MRWIQRLLLGLLVVGALTYVGAAGQRSAATGIDGGIPQGQTGTLSLAPCPPRPWPTPPGDEDCDGWISDIEAYVGTSPLDPCADTPIANDEPDDKWPPDFNDDQQTNIIDVLSFKPLFGSPTVGHRHDLYPDGEINLLDVMSLKPFFGLSCLL
jgi:hypothetical protein